MIDESILTKLETLRIKSVSIHEIIDGCDEDIFEPIICELIHSFYFENGLSPDELKIQLTELTEMIYNTYSEEYSRS